MLGMIIDELVKVSVKLVSLSLEFCINFFVTLGEMVFDAADKLYYLSHEI